MKRQPGERRRTRSSRWVFALGAAVVLLGTATASHAQVALEQLGERLTFVSEDGAFWGRLSTMSDLSLYAAERPPPGLLLSRERPLVAPRVSLTADAGFGERLRLHVRARADRGFDPGGEEGGEVRADEYFLQADVFDAARGRIRLGKFATAFGDWVNRHLSWNNPLITAPALYETMVTVTDAAAPEDLAAFAGRRSVPANKPAWVPVIWGPSYATGAALSLAAGPVDATLEVKNRALSSRPATWDDGFDTAPTITGRLGWHPEPQWTVGVSFSHGPYLQEDAEPTLPAGSGVDDFDQSTVGVDLTFERHHVQLWSEIVYSRFDVPRVGDVDTVGGFVELRYMLAPRYWLAGRVNQSWFGEVPGLDTAWDRNLTRADLALGFRGSANVLAKLEYSVGDQAGRNTDGSHLFAAQVVVRF